MKAMEPDNSNPLTNWILGQSTLVSRPRGRRAPAPDRGLRFVFYGRISTIEYQDPASSWRWQYDSAVDAIGGRGRIVAEYFDIGCSRSIPWHRRPQASALLTALTDPGRCFDAVVVGEYERAFAGTQLLELLPLLDRHGVQLWLPEAGGPIDLDDPTHRALVTLLGHQSRREVLRSRFRTTAAMRAQVLHQGRYQGGRPPYGYRLVDAGPHPNRAHAAWGRRVHRLDPDPDTAPHVQTIFALRLAGESVAGIACTLNHLGAPPPSAHDRARNPHRTGEAWNLRTVAVILANPRYTGRQVWNRQRINHNEGIPGDKRTSHGPVHRWNPKSEWIISDQKVHPPLVTDADFIAAQTIDATPKPEDGSTHQYQLTGLVICRQCGRRADGHWVHDRPGYRCRHGHTSASPAMPGRPKPWYHREDTLLTRVWQQLADRNPLATPEPEQLAAVAAYLRANMIPLECDETTITLEPTPRVSNANMKIFGGG